MMQNTYINVFLKVVFKLLLSETKSAFVDSLFINMKLKVYFLTRSDEMDTD